MKTETNISESEDVSVSNVRPKISVIIPAYNAGSWLPNTLNSIIGQSYHPIEILVIDDGSTDGTDEILRPYADIGQIRYIKKEQGGLQKARNRGIHEATGEFLIFLDADDILSENSIFTLVELITKLGDDYCFVHGNMECFDSDTNEILNIRDYESVTKHRRNIFGDRRNLLLAGIARKTDVIAVNGFNETTSPYRELFGIGNEMQLIMKLAKLNKKMAGTSQITYRYRIRQNSAARTNFYQKTIVSTKVRKQDLQAVLKGEKPWVKAYAWASHFLFAGVDFRHDDIGLSRRCLLLSFLLWPLKLDPVRLLLANLRGRWPEKV